MEYSGRQIADQEQDSSNKHLQQTTSKDRDPSTPSSPSSISSSDDGDACEIILGSPSDRLGGEEQGGLKLVNASVSPQRQAPPVQVMGKTENFDPNRIPSTVFTRTKSQSPMDWSVASNDSLFSLHMGNSSFSRDQILLLGKSGELGAFPMDLHLHSNAIPEASDLDDAGGTSELEDQGGKEDADRSPNQVTVSGTMKQESSGGEEQQHKATAASPTFHLMSPRPSDGSSSTKSFAFPVLTPEETKSSETKKEDSLPPTPLPMREPPPIPTQQTSWFQQILCCS